MLICRASAGPPMVPPSRRGDGRNMRPYGLPRTYPGLYKRQAGVRPTP